jgi:ABC-type multidrug transport system fused ATPase/permease subunit
MGSAIWISPRLALWVFGVLGLGFLPIVVIGNRTRARSFVVRRKGYVLFDVILQILRGLRIIKAYRGEETEASADETLLVGDSTIDLETARNAGIRFCIVSYGMGPWNPSTESPDLTVDDLRDLLPLVHSGRERQS